MREKSQPTKRIEASDRFGGNMGSEAAGRYELRLSLVYIILLFLTVVEKTISPFLNSSPFLLGLLLVLYNTTF